MKTKVIQAILLASILTWVWGSAAWAADRSRERDQQRMQRQTRSVDRGGINRNQSRVQRAYEGRENRQMQRIRNGVRSGDITRNEYRRLHKEQRRFDRSYDRAASDGYMNRHERKRLHNMQDRASRHIYRAKHNNVNRYRHHGHYNWGRYAKRYDGHLERHHYWHFRKRHPRPVVYSYHGPYPAQSYPRVGYALSGSINGPGRTLAFSTGGYW